MKIVVVGAGRMGSALAGLWASAGHDVALTFTRDPEKVRSAVAGQARLRFGDPAEARAADVTMLAIWPDALEAAISAVGDLSEKTVITCVSGLRPDFSGATIGMPTDLQRSMAETVAARLPGAYVVEAFNTTFAEVLEAPTRLIDGERPSVLYCGDDPAAKSVARGLIEDCGFVATDGGALRSARTIETLASAWVQTAVVTGLFPSAGIRILRAPPTG